MIRQFVPQDFCLKCKGCCRFRQADSAWSPCLLDEEIQDLLDKDIPASSISAGRRIQCIPNTEGEGFICPFLRLAENKCKIYNFHPFECQLYPFLIALRDKKVILTLDLNCHYIKGKLNSQELKDYTGYLNVFLNSPKQLRILKENPQIIQAYEDVLNIIELTPPFL